MTVPLYNLTDTWNDGGTVFTAIKMNVTNTASAAGSKLFDLQIATVSQFSVDKSGLVLAPVGPIRATGSVTESVIGVTRFEVGINTTPRAVWESAGTIWFQDNNSGNFRFIYDAGSGPIVIGTLDTSSGYLNLLSNWGYAWNADTILYRDGAVGVIAQRNSTTAQTFRIYNTYTDSSNYERFSIDWITTASTVYLAAEAAGTGTVRHITVTNTNAELRLRSAGSIELNGKASGQYILFTQNNTEWLTIPDNGRSIVLGNAAIATNAADGFLYIPTCAGTPTGTPTAQTGRVPMIFDTTNSQFWFYTGGAWKQPKTPAGAATVTWQ